MQHSALQGPTRCTRCIAPVAGHLAHAHRAAFNDATPTKLWSGPPDDFRVDAVAAHTLEACQRECPQLADLAQAGDLLAFARPAHYRERRDDDYRCARCPASSCSPARSRGQEICMWGRRVGSQRKSGCSGWRTGRSSRSAMQGASLMRCSRRRSLWSSAAAALARCTSTRWTSAT